MPTPRNAMEPADEPVARAATAPVLARDGTRLRDAGPAGRREAMRRATRAEAVAT